jgi:GNAT superfamily N-acetyltransferase
MGADEPTAWVATAPDDLAAAGRLLHDFNTEYGEPAPPPGVLATRLGELTVDGGLAVLLAAAGGGPEGVAVVRLSPSLWSQSLEAYLAELYVVPARRGHGLGRALLRLVLETARGAGADYALVVTSEDDLSAQRAYEAAGFRRTEGEGGPLMVAYELDL